MSGEPELEAIQRAVCCPKKANRCAPGDASCVADMPEHFASACAVRELYRQFAAAEAAAAATGAQSGAST